MAFSYHASSINKSESDVNLALQRQKGTYSLKVFHRVALHLMQVLVAQINVSLGEDVTSAIVVSVSAQIIS